ncbi:MAG TPA: hypothetical protein VGM37_12260 [Armatimonadota bacterium]|jgi:hypothetical protein
MTTLTLDVFRTLLANGHGRAVLYLETHDPAPFREAILHACLNDLRYDRQTENSRAPYLYALIQLSGDFAGLRDCILAALADPGEGESERQLYDLAYEFARRGDAGARAALYAAFDRNSGSDEPLPADSLALLDGPAALSFAAERLLPDEDGEEDWELVSALDGLMERDGVAETRVALETLQSPSVNRLLAFVDREAAERAARPEGPAPRRPALPYSEMRRRILAGDRSRTYPIAMTRWGQRANDVDLLLAANDALAETDPVRRRAFLGVFQQRAWPIDPQPLIALADDPDERVARLARVALGYVAHPSVRGWALEVACDLEMRSFAVGALSTNREPDDDALVASWLEDPPADRTALHCLTWSAIDYAKAHPGPGVNRVLRAVYEHVPCSQCRGRALDELSKCGPLPESIVAEIRHDADRLAY